MTTRQPLQPLSPLSANIVGAKHNYITKVGANVETFAIMDERAHDEDTQGSGSIVSGLTSLENDEADDFDKLMIQNARDERRLQDALQGSVQPFRKARAHPRVGLTLENLERNNALDNGGAGFGAHLKVKSPSSSSGSAPSDPAVRPPPEWGRKARVKRNWLRTITSHEEQGPGAQEDTIDRLVEHATPLWTTRATGHAEADVPRASVEDSPLSHKSSHQGTPASSRRRNAQFDQAHDWDFTLDFNEASMIASTPYIPRNTALDDIRQREIESLKEQAVTRNRLDRIRENSPEEARRPRSSSQNTIKMQTNGMTTTSEQAVPLNNSISSSTELRLSKRINSWKTIGKSQPVTGEAVEQVENSPIVVYKNSSEMVGDVDLGILAKAQTSPKRPKHRREDSHDLLRRLARVSSSTPSPGRVAPPRPQTAPAKQPDRSSLKETTETSQPTTKDTPALQEPAHVPTAIQSSETAPELSLPEKERVAEPQRTQSAPTPMQPPQQADDVDATPMPVEVSLLNAKTPVVTGAWIDTPGPRTVCRTTEAPQYPQSQSSKNGSPSKQSPTRSQSSKKETEEQPKIAVERSHPILPRSALEAIVEEARGNGRNNRHEDQYGDSTIDSLEELIAPGVDDSETADLDEDTLQGLQLPTEPPRNEAERQRQKELVHLHKMNQRLRAARTGVRDASRGIRRVENRIEHFEEDGEKVQVVHHACDCAGHKCSPSPMTWTGIKRFFYDPEEPGRIGLTWAGIALLTFLVWYISENLACERYCHKLYARRMVGFGVDWNAPRYPFVIPTILYRNLLRPIQPLWQPIWSCIAWFWRTLYGYCVEDETTRTQATVTARRMATKVLQQAQKTFDADLSMNDDEIL